eukprot:767389-Hanusia_phi.AAC.2
MRIRFLLDFRKQTNACLSSTVLLVGLLLTHASRTCKYSSSCLYSQNNRPVTCIQNQIVQSAAACFCPFDPSSGTNPPAPTLYVQFIVTCPLCFSDSRLHQDMESLRYCQWPPYLYPPDTSATAKLAEFYDSMNGDLWFRNDNWKTSLSVCSWYGIVCRASSNTIIEIYLSSNNLQGVIPCDFGLSFPFLQILDLSLNKITGSIPSELACIPSLVKLNLNDNRLQGSVPDFSACPFLVEIKVSRNFLQHVVSGSWNSLPDSWQYFDFADNVVSGEVLLISTSLPHID